MQTTCNLSFQIKANALLKGKEVSGSIYTFPGFSVTIRHIENGEDLGMIINIKYVKTVLHSQVNSALRELIGYSNSRYFCLLVWYILKQLFTSAPVKSGGYLPFRTINIHYYYVAELVQGEKEHSDWFPERSEFCYTDR